MYGGASKVGGIVGECSGNIENCTVNSSIVVGSNGTLESNIAIGGICGDLQKGNVKNCTNKAVINNANAGGGSGGIVGIARDAKHNIESCKNEGKIVSKGNMVGGICGVVAGGNNSEITTTITKCKNVANITGATNVGGIAGRLGQNAKAQVDQCYNTGTIEGSSYSSTNNTNTAGIVGATNDNNYIQYSYNTGSVKGTNSSGSSCVGGITGALSSGSTILSCYNTGKLSVTKDLSASGNYYLGGIVGKNTNSGSSGLTNITNTYCHDTAFTYIVGKNTSSNSIKGTTTNRFTTTLSVPQLGGYYNIWKATSTYPTLINNT